jgi:hypothetical protein
MYRSLENNIDATVKITILKAQVYVIGLSCCESYFINFRCLVNMQCYTMLLKLVRSIFEVFWKKSYFP